MGVLQVSAVLLRQVLQSRAALAAENPALCQPASHRATLANLGKVNRNSEPTPCSKSGAEVEAETGGQR